MKSKQPTGTSTQKLESLTKIALWSVGGAFFFLVVLYALSLFVQWIPFPVAADKFGQFGDFFGGVLNPTISALTLYAVWRTLKLQHEKDDAKEEGRLQQDDFNRKFDSYKEVTAQVTSQMLYPWAKNEPAVSGKAALARWLELIKQETPDKNQGSPHRAEMLITGNLIQFMRPQSIGGSRFNRKQLKFMNKPSSLFFIDDFFNNIQLSPLRTMMKQYGISIKRTAKDNLKYMRVRIKQRGNNIVIPILDRNLAKRIGDVVWFFKVDDWRESIKQDVCSACEFEKLGVYFRAVYHVLKSQKCDNYQAKENIRFFRSQLTEAELVLIALNILFHEEGEHNLLPFVKQFGLLKHLFEFHNLHEIIEKEPNYGLDCFKEIE